MHLNYYGETELYVEVIDNCWALKLTGNRVRNSDNSEINGLKVTIPVGVFHYFLFSVKKITNLKF